jgi:hypothetical protein
VCPRVSGDQEERSLALQGSRLLHASVCIALSLQLERSQRIINGVGLHHGGVKNYHHIVTGLPGLTHPLPFWPRDNVIWAGCIWLVISNFDFILFGGLSDSFYGTHV